MKRVAYFALLLFMMSCTNSPKVKEEAGDWLQGGDPTEITCWGIGDIELEDSYDILVEKAGLDHVKQDSLFKEGMFERVITRVWPNTEKEITVYWKEKKAPLVTIEMLELRDSASVYHFANGLKIGSTLQDLVKENGGIEFSFYGFGWDNGGTIVDFNSGKLSNNLPCFQGVLALPQEASADAGAGELMGDKLIKSSHPLFSKFNPRLVNIKIKNVG
ncbi:hypothetical protein B0I27_108116 [Arcticibacter pallidicorallinus]|uniref:Lipoprotein n=1 Tax=Arcticibacter pallidicorallinus TaxID=1259464 RepID=A0A2T0TZC0_9SPHI|nr:hypothetical protein [Arcticibacter pallidicorallinus]PRY50908.1 hypothetical protein B0I27_108116 [Arcticibacter pallidicorallinus]